MSRLAFLLALTPCLVLARPWQGILPAGSSELDVVGKFGEPSGRVMAHGQVVLVYSGPRAIKGTVQAQFKCDPATHEVQRIDVYPEPVIDLAAIEKSYGPGCEATRGAEPCYWRQETTQKRPYLNYSRLGLVIFFKDDGKTVLSFAFLPRAPLKMRLYGLTGGIATGKSTVSAMFREAGVPVIDADALARDVVEPGQSALAEIAARFPGTVSADGKLDRVKLGARIFADPAERAALDAITHPRIQALALEKTAALAATGAKVAIYDAALLIEKGLQAGLSGVILVVCPPALQLSRLMARNALSEAQARERIAAQMPLDEKRPFATWLIDNSGPLEATRAQVKKVISGWVGYGPTA